MKRVHFPFRWLVFFAFLTSIRAHQVATVELEFLKLEKEWRLLGEMDIAYMMPETRDVLGGPPMSRAAVMMSSPEEFSRIRKETENTLRKLLKIRFKNQEVAWRIEFPDFSQVPFELPEEAGDVALLTTELVIDPSQGEGDLQIDWFGERETELIILIEEGDEPKIVSTLPGGSLMLLRQMGSGVSAPVESPVMGGWLQSGFKHVFGWDHLLFIFGLFLLVPKWKPLMWQSLLFTLAHSITLALAVFGLVRMSENHLQALIAASIAWVGIENLLIHRLSKFRLILIFCFGLLHGLSFAETLAEKLNKVPRDQLLGPWLGFNVGVELAQICVLVGAFLLLWPVRQWTRELQRWGSVIIALAGLMWLAQELIFRRV